MPPSFRRSAFILAGALGVGTFVAALPTARSRAADARTKVILNGKPTPVHFNDGDSFRVVGGEYNGAKARMFGYNTLESYGAVHQWGDWTAKELYVVAKMATLHARRGVWECETDGKTDTYGRMLVWCPELAESEVAHGYAHVMSIDDNPGKPELVAAQRKAIEGGKGIWSHGVPAFILTSLHSKEEDVEGRGTYNRLVSSDDGHSVKWKHATKYGECDKVCHEVHSVDDAAIDQLSAQLGSGTGVPAPIQKIVDGLSSSERGEILREYAEYRHIGRAVAPDDRPTLLAHLDQLAAEGALGSDPGSPGACMTYVDFKRRFGGGKAECLK